MRRSATTGEPDSIRIAIADDHQLYLDGLEKLLSGEKGFQIVARCKDGAEALLAVRRRRPDVLLLDYRMPGLNGVDVLRAIRNEQLRVRVVLLAAILEDHQVIEAVKLGVAGIYLKEMGTAPLLQCIRTVQSGRRWLEGGSTGNTLEQIVRKDDAVRDMISSMSKREVEIVCLVANGMRNQEIARKLFISEGTVKVHLHNIYHKLAINGRFALSRFARDRRLVN